MRIALVLAVTVATVVAVACVCRGAPASACDADPTTRRARAALALATPAAAGGISARVDALEARAWYSGAPELDGLHAELDSLNATVDDVRTRLDSIETALNGPNPRGVLGRAYLDASTKAYDAKRTISTGRTNLVDLRGRLRVLQRREGRIVGLANRRDQWDSAVLLVVGDCNNVDEFGSPRNDGFTHAALLRGYTLTAYSERDFKGASTTCTHEWSSAPDCRRFNVQDQLQNGRKAFSYKLRPID